MDSKIKNYDFGKLGKPCILNIIDLIEFIKIITCTNIKNYINKLLHELLRSYKIRKLYFYIKREIIYKYKNFVYNKNIDISIKLL